jgi:hypothetical protein
MTERLSAKRRKISVHLRCLEGESTIHMAPMTDEDTQDDEIGIQLIPVPLCDDEEPVAMAQEPSQEVPSDNDVEGHGTWGVGDTA